MIWIGIHSIYMYTCIGPNLFTVNHPNITKHPSHALLPSYQYNTHIPHFTTSTKCLVWECHVFEDNHALECTVGLKMAAIHCYSVTNFIHFTQQRRVYYSQKQIGFRSSITCTFKNDKLEIGNVHTNIGLWICRPRIHTRIFVKELITAYILS